MAWQTKIAPILIARFGARMYAMGRILAATVSTVVVLLVFAAQFSPGRDSHPSAAGFYVGLIVIGWGASATYEVVTAMVSALSSSSFAAFFVGTYSAAIIFGPVNIATGELCDGDVAMGHAVAWQLGTSAILVVIVGVAFVYVAREPEPRNEFICMDAEVGRILARPENDTAKRPLTAAQRHQLETWLNTRSIKADPWVQIALEFGIEPGAWADISGRLVGDEGAKGASGGSPPTTLNPVAGKAAGGDFGHEESSTDGELAMKEEPTAVSAVPRVVPTFMQSCKLCWKPALGLFINTVINIVVTGEYVRLGVIAVSLFYEFYLGTAVGATFTLSKKLKGLGMNAVLCGVGVRFLYLAMILPASYNPGLLSDAVIHTVNVPWTILGGWCYTMTWIKASAIDGGSRVMPITYFVGMSVGIVIVVVMNENEKSQE
jgi:hypothetical protein